MTLYYCNIATTSTNIFELIWFIKCILQIVNHFWNKLFLLSDKTCVQKYTRKFFDKDISSINSMIVVKLRIWYQVSVILHYKWLQHCTSATLLWTVSVQYGCTLPSLHSGCSNVLYISRVRNRHLHVSVCKLCSI